MAILYTIGSDGLTNTPVNSSNPLSVLSSKQGVLTDRSGAITTGGTSQQLAPANANRRYFIVQNTSQVVITINLSSPAAAVTGSFQVSPSSSFSFEGAYISTEQINVFSATAGATFTAKEG